ncbi:hypothetical protein K3495_g4320 [Podosphaera aphanis]|nr:hypothetical protein K3495_g4320 [Podosphaera aphanis]
MTLPTPHEFLNSLFSDLSTSSSSSSSLSSSSSKYSADEFNRSNPFKSLPQPYQALLISLHVFFPPPMLLQALDILDHGLVTKLILRSDGHPALSESTRVTHETSSDSSAYEDARKEREVKTEYIFYQVHSHVGRITHPSSRHASMYSTNHAYRVHLSSWNCSCAAFAFSAYPTSLPKNSPRPNTTEGSIEMIERNHLDKEEASCPFGGSFCSYGNGEAVPLCKHLLACFLGDRWKSVLGPYLKDRWAEREEIAGLSEY